MAKKKKLESTSPAPMTRGQLSRHHQEQKRIRNLYTAGIGLGTLMVLLLGLAALSTFVLRPNEEVARVNDQSIKRATYNKLRRWSIFQNMQNQAIQEQFGGQVGGTGSMEALQLQLRNVDEETTLDPEIVGTLVDAEVLRQQSRTDFQLNPTREELRAAAIKDFIPEPTPPATPAPTVDLTPTIIGTVVLTPTATSSPTAGSPTTTPTITLTLPPVAGAQQTAEASYTRYTSSIDKSTAPQPNDNLCGAGCPDLSEDDYLNLIMDPRVRREQVIDKLTATSVISGVEQINAQHILTDTEEGAKTLIARLDKGEDFTLLANTQSSEQIRNEQNGQPPNGGNLGWFPREGSGLVEEFVAGAWPVQVGKYSQPVKSEFGWHIIKVLERDPSRPLEESQRETLKTKAFDDWFKKAKDAANIVPRPTPTAAIPTQPAIIPPTAVPGTVPVSGSVTSTLLTTPQTTPAGATTPTIRVTTTPGDPAATFSSATVGSPTSTTSP
ncbi:MAG: peptidylprolyl isomerase [Chloroflexia bacterium]